MSNSRFGFRSRKGEIRSFIEGNVAIPNDVDAQAFINAAGITDPTQRSAINALVVNLKSQSLWTKFKAIYPFVGGTATTHKWNLKDPRDTDAAYRIIWAGGVTHLSTGVTFNGTNGYGDTKFNPAVSLTANNSSLSYYSSTSGAGSGTFASDLGSGTNGGESGFNLSIRRPSNDSFFNAGSSSSANLALTTTTDAKGLFTGTIISNNSRKYFKNATNIAVNTSTGNQNFISLNIFIGAVNVSNVASFFGGVRICSFAHIGDGLTDSDVSNLYTAVQDFQTTLGRQV